VRVGAAPGGIAVTPDGSRVYVANAGDHTVSVIDTASHTVTATIGAAFGNPTGVAVTPDGSRVYVANQQSGSVSVINTRTNTVVAMVAVGSQPLGVAVTPDGSRVYVANGASGTVSAIATATNTVIATVPVGTNPSGIFYNLQGVAVTPDGSRVYVASQPSSTVAVIDPRTNTVIATEEAGNGPVAVAFNLLRPSLGVTHEAVLAFFDQAVAAGRLRGHPGNSPLEVPALVGGRSARRRLQALRGMLVAARDLHQQGNLAAAARQLQAVELRIDGLARVPDFVRGPAAAELFGMVTALRRQVAGAR